MKDILIGGLAVLVIGGAGFVFVQPDVTYTFAEETGMAEVEAHEYVKGAQVGLKPSSAIGSTLIENGKAIIRTASRIDCVNYVYVWEKQVGGCAEGKHQLETIGTSAMTLGYCYQALGADLGESAKYKMSECIADADRLDASYDLPIANELLGTSVQDAKNANLYNKSALRTALGI